MDLYELEKPTGAILQQIKRYHEDPELNYTYKGMELTLKYFYEILGNPVRDGDGIGIIPYMYEEATEQYIHQIKINKSIEKLNKTKKREVYISPNKKKQNSNLIDIESI